MARDGISNGLQPDLALPVWFLKRALKRGQAVGDRMLLGLPCPYCHQKATTVDHVVPRALGGSSHYGNKVGACGACNGLRGIEPFLSWLLRLGPTGIWRRGRVTGRVRLPAPSPERLEARRARRELRTRIPPFDFGC